MAQANAMREMKTYGTLTHFACSDFSKHKVSILVYNVAGRHAEAAQASCVAGLLVAEFEKESIFHLLARSSHKFQRPVRSAGAPDIFGCGEGINEG